MKSELNYYLLSEYTGWSCIEYAYTFRSDLFSSEAYAILNANIIEAKKHFSQKAKDLLKETKALNLEPKSVKEYYLTDIKINYLALNSYPEFYLNPLLIDPDYNGSITTIGDLIFKVDDENYTLNELIIDEDIDDEKKLNAIEQQLNYYQADMSNMTTDTIISIENRAKENKEIKKDNRHQVYSVLILLISTFLLFFIYIYPFNSFRDAMYKLDLTKVSSVLGLLTPILYVLYLGFYLAYHAIRSRKNEHYNYAKRFLKRNSDSIYSDIQKARDELFEYIKLAIESKIELENDITKFSKLSSSYIDFKKLRNESNKNSTVYNLFHILSNIFTVVFIIIFIALVAVFFIDIYLGNVLWK